MGVTTRSSSTSCKRRLFASLLSSHQGNASNTGLAKKKKGLGEIATSITNVNTNVTTAKEEMKEKIDTACCAEDKTLKGSVSSTNDEPLHTLPSDCIEAVFVCRPSKRNRSPYVADIFLPSLGREGICHVPNLDMGGKCKKGVKLLVKPQKDKKGNLLGPNAVSPKYNTPKCEFIAQLLYCDESNLHSLYRPTWVGAHPSLGEVIVREMLRQHTTGVAVIPGIDGGVTKVKEQATVKEGSRADFVIEWGDGKKKRIIEVKTVVDTDYCATWTLPQDVKCLFKSARTPYRRTGLFPWGNTNQKGPNGEPVVSARAIKHVRELTGLVRAGDYDATVLFVVIRGDAEAFRPNVEACPSFATHLKEAEKAGVQILVKRVRWGDGKGDGNIGDCIDDGWLDMEWT